MTIKTALGQSVFDTKYARFPGQTWEHKSREIADIAKDHLTEGEYYQLLDNLETMKFIPGGRYIYYAGRTAKMYNNCFLFKSEEDTREEWARFLSDVPSALMVGGGIGNDYSVFRPQGSLLASTGGFASGPLPLMCAANETGRSVKQGGSRRSAIYASLNWQHGDIKEFMHMKDYEDMPIAGAYNQDGSQFTVKDAKEADFDYPAPMDMTNISPNYDNAWLNCPNRAHHPTFLDNVRQGMKNGEPGFSFNFDDKQNETARNACTEVASEDNGDVCNLGSPNMANVKTIEDWAQVVHMSTKFLLIGTIEGQLPTEKIKAIREKNRRLGLGLMGVHEWLLQRGHKYGPNPELTRWLEVWRDVSDRTAREFSAELGISAPIAVRAIAPAGSIALLAGTTSGMEVIYAVSYMRRYLTGTGWKFQYCLDATAKSLLDNGILDKDSIDKIDTALSLSTSLEGLERRLEFQAYLQDYTDMCISSTINLPEWNAEGSFNCEENVKPVAELISKYAHRLRGLTMYPDGSRGGQPIVPVPFEEIEGRTDIEFDANDQCSSGVCGT